MHSGVGEKQVIESNYDSAGIKCKNKQGAVGGYMKDGKL